MADLDLAAIHRQAAQELAGAPAEEILGWAADTFGSRAAISCSFGGPGGIVLAHMAHQWGLRLPLIFIDTGFLFPETYQLKEELESRWGLLVRTVHPSLSPDEQASRYGDRLWERDPDRCCFLRKVQPMAKVLEGLDCWITPLRRDQGPSRASVEPIELHRLASGRALLKLNPLAHWTRQRLWNYVARHKLPYNPLLDRGFKSIGCVQCTAPAYGDNERAGRWQGHAKSECGLHTFTQVVSERRGLGPLSE